MQVRVPQKPCSILCVCIVHMLLACLFHSTMEAQHWQSHLLGEGESHHYVGGFLGGGLSAADFDKDGYDDLLFCQRGSNPLLFKSDGVTLQPWPLDLQNSGEIKQLTWVDFDNDGDRDLSMTGLYIPVQLFCNDSNVFTSLHAISGISPDTIVSYGHSWGDYDLDGDLDLFVCNYDAQFMGYGSFENQLYRNEGNAFFTDVTIAAGFQAMTNYTFMALWMDYNRDLFPDLLVINDRFEVPNYFYHNNGDGTFTEISAQINLDDYMFGMTATADDFDNDGDLDVYITNGTAGNKHKINNGDGMFTDADEQLGTTLNRFCWAAQFIDADRDGLQDLHICSTPHVSLPGQNFLYRNDGSVFVPDTESAGIASDGGWSRSSALGDFNGDGLADIGICKSYPSLSSVWMATPDSANWLKVTLEGVQSNRDGVSSWIDCYAGGSHQCRYTYCGEGYLGQNSFSEFFGFGSTAMIDSLVVSWPSGVVDRWHNIPTDQQLHLVEGTSTRVDIHAPDGFTYCSGDSISLTLTGWSEVLWSTGSHEAMIRVGDVGSVWVLATDAWGNQFLSDTLLILQNPEPQLSIAVSDVSCTGFNDGVIEITAHVGGVIFSMDGFNIVDTRIENLNAGSYHVMWIDSLGCSGWLNAEVSEPEPLNAIAIVEDISCNGAHDGSVTFDLSGGTPEYYLMGEDASTDQLGPGSYVFIWSDSRGCVVLVSASLDEPAPLSLQVSSISDLDDISSGAVLCEVSGGTLPYAFYLNGVYSASCYWSNLDAGAYEVLVSDSLQCEAFGEVFVGTPTGMVVTESPAVRVQPNPVRKGEQLAIEMSAYVHDCLLYDMHGVLVCRFKPTLNGFTLDMSGISPGQYMLVGLAGVNSICEMIVVLD